MSNPTRPKTRVNRLVPTGDKISVDGPIEFSDQDHAATFRAHIGAAPANAAAVKITVANQTARFALTTEQVQNGDYVYQTDTQALYEVTDDQSLDSSAGYTKQVISGISDVPGLTEALAGKLTAETCESHGASTSATSAENVAAIQAALDVGGLVTLTEPGIIYVNDTLKIGSNTRFVVGPNTEIRLGPTSMATKNLIATKAISAAWTDVTVTWGSANDPVPTPTLQRMTINWTAHPFSVGEAIWIRGITPSNFNGVFWVEETATDSLVVILDRVPDAPGATPASVDSANGFASVQAKKANVNVSIEGGVWNQFYDTGGGSFNTGAAAGSHQERVALRIGGAANVRVSSMTVKRACKYLINVGGCRDFRISDITAGYSFSDMVKVYGPAYGGVIERLNGRGDDDVVSLHPREYTDFDPGWQWTYGDVLNVTIREINAANSRGSAVVCYGYGGYYIDGVSIDGVRGVANQAVQLKTYASTAVGSIGVIEIRNVSCQTLYTPVFLDKITVGSLVIDGLRVRKITNTDFLLYASATVNVASAAVRRLYVNALLPWGTPHPTYAGKYLAYLDGTWGTFTLEDSVYNRAAGASTGTLWFVQSASNTVGRVIVSRCTIGGTPYGPGSVILFTGTSKTARVSIRDCTIKATQGVVVSSSGTTNTVYVDAENTSFDSTTGGVACADGGSGHSLTLTGRNIALSTGAILSGITGTHTVAVNVPDSTQSISYAANPALTTHKGQIIAIGALTGDIEIANPTYLPPSGSMVSVAVVQDGTGGRNVTWGTSYKFPTAWSNTGNTANKRTLAVFRSDGTYLWAIGANTWE